jgi:protein-arginine kinase activator protein McsA
MLTPRSIVKTEEEIIKATSVADYITTSSKEEIKVEELAKLYNEMKEAVSLMEFERAAEIRDRIKLIKQRLENKEGRKYQKEVGSKQ